VLSHVFAASFKINGRSMRL